MRRLNPRLHQFLVTAVEMLGADKGNVQFYDEERQMLTIAAHIGFNDEFLTYFKNVPVGFSVCGIALKRRERVVMEDVRIDPLFSYLVETFSRYGFSSVISTPLFDESGKLFGVLSVHFAKPHRPSKEKLEMLDSYIHQAAPLIARKQREAVYS